VQTLRNTFRKAVNANASLYGWDVSSVTSLADTFNGASNFELNAGGGVDVWDVRKVVNMVKTFRGASKANPFFANWHTESLEDLESTFEGAAAMVGLGFEGAGWDTRKVHTMKNAFKDSPLADPNLAGWDATSLTAMDGMFQNCASFRGRGMNETGWSTTGKVATMLNVLDGAAVFDADLSLWNLASTTTLENAFRNAQNFAGVGLSGAGWANTNKVTTLKNTFEGTTALDPDFSPWNITSVSDMENTFKTLLPCAEPVWSRPGGSWARKSRLYSRPSRMRPPRTRTSHAGARKACRRSKTRSKTPCPPN
jgi:hypothetical protein